MRGGIVVVVALAGVAHADRGLHGSAGIGGSLVMTGAQGDRFRLDLTVDLKPRSRYGVVVGWRAFDEDHRGLVTAGLAFEGAASRPRLVVDLHADVGLDLDATRPLVGGGIRTTLMIYGPFGVVLDTGGYLVIDGIDDSRLQLQGATLFGARW
ncbi:MAG: hypothetical protein JNL83_14230 [Myxococcales bacterium]|nr:hypothetical protein [Myxococcales bacterium]